MELVEKNTHTQIKEIDYDHIKMIEEAVLSSVIKGRCDTLNVFRKINEGFFSSPKTKDIWEAIKSLHNKNKSINHRTVAVALKKGGRLNMAYLHRVAQIFDDPSHFEDHVEILREKAGGRALEGLSTIITKGIKQHKDVASIITYVEESLRNIKERASYQEDLDPLDAYFEDNEVGGVTTGFKRLDNVFSDIGWRVGLNVIAAPPGMGKTSLMINSATELLKLESDGAVLFFSIEMPPKSVIDRLISIETGIDNIRVENKKEALTAEELNKVRMVRDWAKSKHLIIDCISKNVYDIQSIARQNYSQYGLKAIYIDYLQDIKTPNYVTIPEQKVAMVSSELRALANELKVPIILASQVNRNKQFRGGENYTLSDIRQSDSINYDACSVSFLQEESDGMKIFVAKNRYGTKGKKVDVVFDKKTQKFSEPSVEDLF